MIIKCLSRKSNVDQLIRYILADEKIEPIIKLQPEKQLYVPGVKLSKEDRKYLEAERNDSRLVAELKGFKGTVKDFVKNMINPEAKNISNNSKETDKSMLPIIIKQNIRSRSVNGYIKEFAANESLRLNSRKDSVKAFHNIISFSRLDSPQLNEKVLKDIAQKFISLRGENSLYVGAVHQDREHVHIHLVMSGTQYLTGKGNRISKNELLELKNTLQQYQKDKYPQLVNSLPEHGKGEKGLLKNINSERCIDKVSLLGLLETAYNKSTSIEHFLTQMKYLGHEPYFRNGKLQGIKFDGERKFRLNRLGYDEKKIMELNKKEKSLKEIQSLRNGRTNKFKEVVIEDKGKANATSHTVSKVGNELQELREIRESRSKDLELNDSINSIEQDITDNKNSNDNSNDDNRNTDKHTSNNNTENSVHEQNYNGEYDDNNEK